MSAVYEIKSRRETTIHDMRQTHAGIEQLKQTGLFREYMRNRAESQHREFISWDGEGWTDYDGEHRYMLMQCSTGDYIKAPRLDTVSCLELMLKVAAEHPKVIHVIYGGGYDATHILRDLPIHLRQYLRDNNTIKFYVHNTKGHKANLFHIRYLPHKWLEISGMDWNSRSFVHIKLFDVISFFQSSFITALESRHIPVPEIIVSGKASRQDFTYDDVNEVQTYCQIELELLVQLCDTLRHEFELADINVTQYHGPGAVANAIFKQHHIRKHMQPPTLELERAAQGAYFGGRFERFKCGHYEGKVYLYDINSAYPYHIENLPSLKDATWEYTTEFTGEDRGVWYCTYDDECNNYRSPHPLPWRAKKNGLVGFPAHNAGVWVWTPEAKYASTVHYGYRLHIANNEKPFSFITEMYETRRRWKREGNGGERAYKLALNSLYGKMAQRVGGSKAHEGRPSWHQLEWAGMVTSATRAQIWEAIKLAPDKIISVETDSIASTVPLDLDIGMGLGQWEPTEYDWITYLQSGVYFTSDEAHGQHSKTRGIDVRELKYDEVLAYLNSDLSEPLLVNSRQFIGLGNSQKFMYGQWQDSTKSININGGKRSHAPNACNACDHQLSMAYNLHETMASPLYGNVESTRHSLPWLDGDTITSDDISYVGNDAIEEWDTPRHSTTLQSITGGLRLL